LGDWEGVMVAADGVIAKKASRQHGKSIDDCEVS
jgi:hypothetical protein